MNATQPVPSTTLHEIIYVSAAQGDFDAEHLARLLQIARERNAAIGVTGMLVYIDGSFIQVLEGSEDAVERTFARISKDPRHGKVLVLRRGAIDERRFATWAMGYAAAGPEHGRLEGYSDYVRTQRLDHVASRDLEERVFDLLARFRDGAYRRA